MVGRTVYRGLLGRSFSMLRNMETTTNVARMLTTHIIASSLRYA